MAAHLKTALAHFAENFFNDLHTARTQESLEAVRLQYLSRQGQLAQLVSELKNLSTQEKRVVGPEINTLKSQVQQAFEEKKKDLEQQLCKQELERSKDFDVTAYSPHLQGSLHPYTFITEHIETIFMSMGFKIAEGPEVETPFYNFEALNIPADHPAREMQDTFWLTLPGYLMRTHTSSVQIRTLLENKPPLAICVPGRAYRHEATDATHDFVFTQLEGLVIDKNLSLAHLLGTLDTFMKALFDNQALQVRVRPSYFPFVEPGLEVDVTCPFCTTGCTICKKRRWIELGGAGMVHPHVLRACNLDPEEWSGFAFGLGLERLAMLKYHIHDIRLFKTGKLDFLSQF